MADLEDENRMLILLAFAAELQQTGADRRIVDPRQVAADLILGKARATRKSLQTSPDKRLEITAVLGLGERQLFAEVQHLERAGFELADLRPRICLGRPVLVLIWRDDRIVRAGLRDEPGDHRREFLADDLGVRVLLQFVELRDYRCQPRLPSKLTG